MEGAINAETGEYVKAVELELNASYQFPYETNWYLDPNDIEDYDKTKVKDISKVLVKYRKGKEYVIRTDTGTEYSIPPCFYIPNKKDLGIEYIPESKEHKLAKTWIYNKLKSNELKFVYSSVSRPFAYENQIPLSELNVDYSKIGIEILVKNNKRQVADIILPLKKYDSCFGFGIVVEIQFSKQEEKITKRRSYEWAFKGYSISWVWQSDFEKLSSDLIELKGKQELFLQPTSKLIEEFKDNSIREVREKTENLSRQIDKKMEELNYPFSIGECKVCGEGYMTKKKNKKGGEFYGCSAFRINGCGHSIQIPKK